MLVLKMTTILKGEIVLAAYADMRISGLTTDPTPEDMELGLSKLEAMASEIEHTRNVCVGYVYEEYPDPNTESGIPFHFKNAFASALIIRLVSAFGKTSTPEQVGQANQAMSAMLSKTITVRPTQYPQRQPRGHGNDLRYNRWQHFYRQISLAPISCETQQINQGEINDYSLDLSEYLSTDETIDSYECEAGSGLSIISESLSAALWAYRVEADESSLALNRVQLTVVTSEGRKQTFTINFNVSIVPEVS